MVHLMLTCVSLLYFWKVFCFSTEIIISSRGLGATECGLSHLCLNLEIAEQAVRKLFDDNFGIDCETETCVVMFSFVDIYAFKEKFTALSNYSLSRWAYGSILVTPDGWISAQKDTEFAVSSCSFVIQNRYYHFIVVDKGSIFSCCGVSFEGENNMAYLTHSLIVLKGDNQANITMDTSNLTCTNENGAIINAIVSNGRKVCVSGCNFSNIHASQSQAKGGVVYAEVVENGYFQLGLVDFGNGASSFSKFHNCTAGSTIGYNDEDGYGGAIFLNIDDYYTHHYIMPEIGCPEIPNDEFEYHHIFDGCNARYGEVMFVQYSGISPKAPHPSVYHTIQFLNELGLCFDYRSGGGCDNNNNLIVGSKTGSDTIVSLYYYYAECSGWTEDQQRKNLLESNKDLYMSGKNIPNKPNQTYFSSCESLSASSYLCAVFCMIYPDDSDCVTLADDRSCTESFAACCDASTVALDCGAYCVNDASDDDCVALKRRATSGGGGGDDVLVILLPILLAVLAIACLVFFIMIYKGGKKKKVEDGDADEEKQTLAGRAAVVVEICCDDSPPKAEEPNSPKNTSELEPELVAEAEPEPVPEPLPEPEPRPESRPPRSRASSRKAAKATGADEPHPTPEPEPEREPQLKLKPQQPKTETPLSESKNSMGKISVELTGTGIGDFDPFGNDDDDDGDFDPLVEPGRALFRIDNVGAGWIGNGVEVGEGVGKGNREGEGDRDGEEEKGRHYSLGDDDGEGAAAPTLTPMAPYSDED